MYRATQVVCIRCFDTYVIVVGGAAHILTSLFVCMAHHVVILATMRSLVDVISCCFPARALPTPALVFVFLGVEAASNK